MRVTKEMMGCAEPVKLKYKKENFLIYRCLGNYVSDEIKSWVDCATQFNKGVMPFDGTYMDQPSKAIDLINLINQLRDERIAEREEKNRNSKSRIR